LILGDGLPNIGEIDDDECPPPPRDSDERTKEWKRENHHFWGEPVELVCHHCLGPLLERVL
jgi:hypothetical protein